ncbi:hypothetical protein Glove_420g113 [Diversispora epigaea]|uniref:Uncharacterized protein n=1 Tax=Diversispora epigaea TaxID=1348612 RepID=A0A397H076_9GLOM|nr:hypothetical protein Glove_420g113 [Diversispora epigaea]
MLLTGPRIKMMLYTTKRVFIKKLEFLLRVAKSRTRMVQLHVNGCGSDNELVEELIDFDGDGDDNDDNKQKQKKELKLEGMK